MTNRLVNNEILLNRKQIATYFGVHVTTVNEWLKKGCPFIQTGTGRKMYRLDDVEKWYRGR